MGLYDYTIYNVIQRNAKIQKDRVACGLINAGLERGDRIGILAQNSMEYVYLYGAAAKIGAVMLPVNWRLQPEEVEYVISDGEPKIMFAGTGFQKLAGE